MLPLNPDSSELGVVRVEKKFGLDHTGPHGGKYAMRGPLDFPSVYTKVRRRVRCE